MTFFQLTSMNLLWNFRHCIYLQCVCCPSLCKHNPRASFGFTGDVIGLPSKCMEYQTRVVTIHACFSQEDELTTSQSCQLYFGHYAFSWIDTLKYIPTYWRVGGVWVFLPAILACVWGNTSRMIYDKESKFWTCHTSDPLSEMIKRDCDVLV